MEPRSPALQVNSLPAEPQGKPKNTGVGSLALLEQIFPTQESNQGLQHCRWILYQQSYQRSPTRLMGKIFDGNTLRPECIYIYSAYIWMVHNLKMKPFLCDRRTLELLLEDPGLSAFAFSAPPHPEPLLKLYVSTPCGDSWALSLSNTVQPWLTLKTQLSVNSHVWKPTMLRSHTYWKMVVMLIRNSPFYMWSRNWAGPCGTPGHKRLSVSLVFLLAGNSYVRMWELDYKESWVPKNWCFWTMVLEKTLESPLDCKES